MVSCGSPIGKKRVAKPTAEADNLNFDISKRKEFEGNSKSSLEDLLSPTFTVNLDFPSHNLN